MIAVLARKVLAIPAPAQSKRLFSKAGKVEPAIIPFKRERGVITLSAHCVARDHDNSEQRLRTFLEAPKQATRTPTVRMAKKNVWCFVLTRPRFCLLVRPLTR